MKRRRPGWAAGSGASVLEKIELFHAIADAGSAAARRLMTERGLESRVRIRNVFYPEVAADLAARGGTSTPAVWDGERLIQGTEAVLAALAAL
ncbi:MAG: hypothetical protein EXR72_27240 [Myxococcales bacterium]|nr:hypothetical protein [Myxococcales bacterium]